MNVLTFTRDSANELPGLGDVRIGSRLQLYDCGERTSFESIVAVKSKLVEVRKDKRNRLI